MISSLVAFFYCSSLRGLLCPYSCSVKAISFFPPRNQKSAPSVAGRVASYRIDSVEFSNPTEQRIGLRVSPRGLRLKTKMQKEESRSELSHSVNTYSVTHPPQKRPKNTEPPIVILASAAAGAAPSGERHQHRLRGRKGNSERRSRLEEGGGGASVTRSLFLRNATRSQSKKTKAFDVQSGAKQSPPLLGGRAEGDDKRGGVTTYSPG
ncbi:hypothetical protein H6P81_005760 [Aristolochia fimbriata]|uniref:Uncharacterized protein n=1 Tax=Aristolochia fimbriata TaxID=158543 RepID=A0AAV7EWI7_ARIFI|nr:hypothetical protein H6P81_005760 [Aristolochia fimbriata]